MNMDDPTPWVCDTWWATEQDRTRHQEEFVCYDERAERSGKVSKTAVLVTGPRWWGDVSVDRARQPISLEERDVCDARQIEVDMERRAVEDAVASLPEGTLVLQGAARGADTLTVSAAQRRKLPIASVPYFGHLGRQGGQERNEAMIAMLKGLEAAGWKVKVLGFLPERRTERLAGREIVCATEGTLSCMKMAEEAGIFVKVQYPVAPPEPEVDAEESVDQPTGDEVFVGADEPDF
jgi:hypothetical protein